MHFQQIYLGCLAQASYLIGADGVAAIVDPRRDVDDYLDLAARHGLKIEHVWLTHVHADFVAGHLELRDRTGARMAMSHRVACGFPCAPLREGDVLRLGPVAIEPIETPGHTPGDLCFLVRDGADPSAKAKLLSGDTLFVGDVGRPDLAEGLGHTAADMAAMMYDSLRRKVLPLADDVEVWPGHGPGSACGKNIGPETSSTIGQQRLANWALQEMTRPEFVRQLTEGGNPPPRYFARAAATNRKGPPLLRTLPALRQLSPAALPHDAQVLDVRSAAAYGAEHVAGALNVGLAGSFETWCGTLLDLDRPLAIAADDARAAAEARMRLCRIGVDAVAGWIAAADRRGPGHAVARLPQLAVADLRERIRRDDWQVVDVRTPGEYRAGHAPTAVPAPLAALPHDQGALAELDRRRPTAIICGSGYRSSAASQLLRRAGFTALHNVAGGTMAWINAGFEVEK